MRRVFIVVKMMAVTAERAVPAEGEPESGDIIHRGEHRRDVALGERPVKPFEKFGVVTHALPPVTRPSSASSADEESYAIFPADAAPSGGGPCPRRLSVLEWHQRPDLVGRSLH